MVETRMDELVWLRNQLEVDGNDLLREMVRSFAQGLMSAEADVVCGAPWGQQSPDRVNRRNGYRTRRWDTRVGSIELRIPKLRRGSYFPEWLLDARTRSERAFVQVVTEAYVRGISTRKVEGLVEALGVTSLSKSQVSELARELDQTVSEFRKAAPRCRSLHVCVGRRAGGQMPRGGPCRECGAAVGCWGEQRRTSRNTGC